MTTRVGRTVRLSALALATGTVVVAATTGAHAAPSASTKVSYAGNTGSSVVALQLNIPDALSGPLAPVLSQLNATDGSIDLSLLNQVGSLQHDASGKVKDVATSSSTFAGGTLFDATGALASLNQTITSTLAQPGTKTSSNLGGLPSNIASLLSIGLPALKVATVTAPIGTSGDSQIANVDLGKIADLLPAGSLDTLESLLNSVGGTAAAGGTTLTGTLTSTLSGVVGQLGSAGLPTTVTAPVQTALTNLQTVLTQLSNEIPTLLTNLEDGSIVSIDGLEVQHSVSTSGNQEISTVSNKLAGINLLGGLFTLDGFANSVTTEAGGTAGSAKVIAQPNLAKATLGTNKELAATIGELSTVSGSIADLADGLTGTAGTTLGSSLSSITSQISTITNALNSLTSVAGIHINADAVTTDSAAKDGSSAKAALSGLQVTIADPTTALGSLATRGQSAARPAATGNLLNLQIGALQASSAAGVVAPASTTTPTTPSTPTKRLAYTGADLPITAGVASLLVLGGAYALRRRRQSGAVEEI